MTDTHLELKLLTATVRLSETYDKAGINGTLMYLLYDEELQRPNAAI